MSATSAGRRHLLDSLIRQYAPNSQSPRWGYYQLIDAIRQRSSALSVRNAQISNHNAWNTADLLRSIRAMSFHFRDRVRSPWDWNCEGNPLQSLSSHLFARFGVAKFMHRAWLEAPAAAQLLIDLGQGHSGERLSRKITIEAFPEKRLICSPMRPTGSASTTRCVGAHCGPVAVMTPWLRRSFR